MRLRRRHGQRRPAEDPKVAALREARCLNPHPQDVTDEAFLAADFFDARDAVQVKYEMVRRVKADGAPVTAAAAAFGYSRAVLLRGGRRAGASPGWTGWCRPSPGRGAATSSPRRSWRAPSSSWQPTRRCRPAGLPDPSPRRFGVRVHPRSVERALARRRERTPKAADPPARERGKEENPSLSLRPSPGHAAAEPGTRPDAGQAHRSRRRAGRPLRAAAPCRPARARRGVPARPRRPRRQGRHRLAARPGQPHLPPAGRRHRAGPAARCPASRRRAHRRPGRLPSRSPAPDRALPPAIPPRPGRERSTQCSPIPRRRR